MAGFEACFAHRAAALPPDALVLSVAERLPLFEGADVSEGATDLVEAVFVVVRVLVLVRRAARQCRKEKAALAPACAYLSYSQPVSPSLRRRRAGRGRPESG